MEQLLTADPAVRAGRADFLGFPGAPQTFGFFLRQGANRTNLNALSAEHAFAHFIIIGFVAAGNNFTFLAAIALRDGAIHDNLVAGLYAAAAKNAAAEIAHDKGILIFFGIDLFFILLRKQQFSNFIKISQILKAAIAVGFAHQAIMFATGQ